MHVATINSFFLVSLPEAFFNLIIGLLITSKTHLLPVYYYMDDDGVGGYEINEKMNLPRFFFTVFFMALSSVAVKSSVHNLILQLSINILLTTILLKVVYQDDLSFRNAFNVTLSFATYLIILEALLTPFLVQYVFKDFKNIALATEWEIFYTTLPFRFIQILTIISLWKFEHFRFMIKPYSNVSTYIIVVAGVILQGNFFIEYVTCFNYLPFVQKITSFICLIGFSIYNYVCLTYVGYIIDAIQSTEWVKLKGLAINEVNGYVVKFVIKAVDDKNLNRRRNLAINKTDGTENKQAVNLDDCLEENENGQPVDV